MHKSDAIAVIERNREKFCAVSDAIWENPELGYHEYFAAGTYVRILEELGFSVEKNLAGIPTAFCGVYGSGRPVIGILGEFDALDGLSQAADLDIKRPVREGGAGHGCGHNLLGAGALAAAAAVKAYLEAGHPGTVKFFGCPAEEGGAGKGFMARDGVFQDLDAALTWHPGDNCSVMTGSSLANYQICYHFQGISSHAGLTPELGRSALDACELMNVGVQFLREHISSQCRIHYAILNTGGKSPGVVQALSDVLYLMRAPSLSEAADLLERVDNIAKGAALMTGTSVSAEFIKACSNVLPNRVLCRVLQKNLEEIGAPRFDGFDRSYAKKFRSVTKTEDSYYRNLVQHVQDDEIRKKLTESLDCALHEQILPLSPLEPCSAASSDVGDVSVVCPTAQLGITTMPAGTPMHSWQEVAVGKSALAKKGMLQAGKILAGAAIDLLADPALLQQAKEELNRRTGGISFRSPIPGHVKPPIG